ncbi:Hypothetical predicted protein, partial [Mytilus galloprovincialis]
AFIKGINSQQRFVLMLIVPYKRTSVQNTSAITVNSQKTKDSAPERKKNATSRGSKKIV